MRASQFFIATLKEAPADAEVAPAADTDSSGAASESVSSDADDAAKDEA